jgi:hypothetical protein
VPAEQPGSRYSVTATKATEHGKPAVENRHAGVAAKSEQADPAYPNAANALLAQDIAIGEEFVIMLDGAHELLVADLPAGAAVGDGLWIEIADNSLANAAEAQTGGITEAAYVKFGVISSIDVTAGRALVNLNQRSILS